MPEVSAVQNEAGDGAGNGGQVGALVDEEGLAPRLPFTEQVKHLSEGLVAGAVDKALVLPRLLCGQLGHRDHDLVTVSVSLFYSLKECHYRIGGVVRVQIEFIGFFVNKFNSKLIIIL